MDQYPGPDAAPVPMAAGWPSNAPAPLGRDIPFQFTGKTSEYFRIWIVNTLLTIVTLGIYSAWAKVRSRQYFYRNTWVDGSSFEYLADPLRILKGRLIIAAAFGLLFGSQFYSPVLYVILIILAVLVTPWVMVKALTFNARNSAYRNVRFSFEGRAAEAFKLYFGLLFVYLLTCGLGYPYMQWRLSKFVAVNHNFGDKPFVWWSTANDYFKTYLLAFAMVLPMYVVFFVGMVAMGRAGRAGAGSANNPLNSPVFIVLILVFYAYLLIPAAFIRARVANLFYGGLVIGDHSLKSTQRVRELLSIYATNALGVFLSLGLLIPWAKIRLANYRASRLVLHARGPLDVIAVKHEDANAIGDAATDLGDFDLDLGV